MKERIFTIPINEAFEKADGCPLCRLRNELERRAVEYITGAAMMEPDVRTECNRLGFCARHYSDMLSQKNRLSVALTMESRLSELSRIISASPDLKNTPSRFSDSMSGCFVCEKTKSHMKRYCVNTVSLWKNEASFREGNFNMQPYFCVPHLSELTACAAASLSKKDFASFYEQITSIERTHIDALSNDISAFCKSFDYRNNGKDIGNAKLAAERAAVFLSGSSESLCAEKP